MNRIESLIFNELASHRPVALPRVGTLRVVRRHARTEGGEMKAPENKVVYSMETDNDIPTVTSLGVDDHEYGQWLDDAFRGDELMIAGVGALVLGEFSPSPELEQILNPANVPATCEPSPETESHHAHHLPTQPHTEEHGVETHNATSHAYAEPVNTSKRRCLTKILIIIAVVLLLAFWGLFFWRMICRDRAKTEVTTYTRVEKPVVREVTPVEVAPAEPEYHLIAGSFDDPQNAEKMAERYRKRFPNLDVIILDNGSGRKLVSVFKSSTQREAYNKFYPIAEQTGNWDMWVFDRIPSSDL